MFGKYDRKRGFFLSFIVMGCCLLTTHIYIKRLLFEMRLLPRLFLIFINNFLHFPTTVVNHDNVDTVGLIGQDAFLLSRPVRNGSSIENHNESLQN